MERGIMVEGGERGEGRVEGKGREGRRKGRERWRGSFPLVAWS